MQRSILNYAFAAVIIATAGRLVLSRPQTKAAENPPDANNSLPFPYVAEATDQTLDVYAGPGTQYYRCGKLKKGDRVTVVSTRYTWWSQIVPHMGSFSWIPAEDVRVDSNNPFVGVVSNTDVPVYAGSDYVRPIHSDRLQRRLSTGDKVRLLGQKKEQYYKIAPPEGAYLWVSSRGIKPLGPVGEVSLLAKPEAKPKPEHKPKEPNEPPELKKEKPVLVPPKKSISAEQLSRYRDLEKKIEAEKSKPIGAQDYSAIKKALKKIAADKNAGKASRYAEHKLERIKRYEMALEVDKALKMQERQLAETEQRISQARRKRLSAIKNYGRFAVVGVFKDSKVYGPEKLIKHYRIVDETGKNLCYAVPENPLLHGKLKNFIGHNVGLVGTIEPHQQTQGALVRFRKIEKLD